MLGICSLFTFKQPHRYSCIFIDTDIYFNYFIIYFSYFNSEGDIDDIGYLFYHTTGNKNCFYFIHFLLNSYKFIPPPHLISHWEEKLLYLSFYGHSKILFCFCFIFSNKCFFQFTGKKNSSIWKILWHAIKGSVELYMDPITLVLVLLLWLWYITR